MAKLDWSEEEEEVSDNFLPISLVIHESVDEEEEESLVLLMPGTTRGILYVFVRDETR